MFYGTELNPNCLLLQPYHCIIFCLTKWSLPTARNEPIASIFYLWVLHLHDRGEGGDIIISLNTEYWAVTILSDVLPMAETESPWWWPPPTPPRWSLPWRQARQCRQEISKKENKILEKKRMIYLSFFLLLYLLIKLLLWFLTLYPFFRLLPFCHHFFCFKEVCLQGGTVVTRCWKKNKNIQTSCPPNHL